jgi:hypothetical protein
MIPSPVPHELQDLTQVEEMLIARALPIMRVYINLGDNVDILAIALTCHKM